MRLDLESGHKTALATADVARGWRRLKNTSGFCEESRLELVGDEVLRVQASVYAWPNFFSEAAWHNSRRFMDDWRKCGDLPNYEAKVYG
jgi:hypothetical protein